MDDYQAIPPAFGEDVYAVFDPLVSINRRSAWGDSGGGGEEAGGGGEEDGGVD